MDSHYTKLETDSPASDAGINPPLVPPKRQHWAILSTGFVWYAATLVSVLGTKTFLAHGGDPISLSLLTFLVGAAPLLWLESPASLSMQSAFGGELGALSALHCCNTVMTMLGLSGAGIRTVYCIKSLEPCGTALLQFLFFGKTLPLLSTASLLSIPALTYVAIQGDGQVTPFALAASLFSVMTVCGRTLLFKSSQGERADAALSTFSAINLISLGYGSLFVLVRPPDLTQYVDEKVYVPAVMSIVAALLYNGASFRMLELVQGVTHSTNNVLKRLMTALASSVYRGKTIAWTSVLAVIGSFVAAVIALHTSKMPKSEKAQPLDLDRRSIRVFTMATVGLSMVFVAVSGVLQGSALSSSYAHVDLAIARQDCPPLEAEPSLLWFHPPGREHNFGDAMNPDVVSRVLGRPVMAWNASNPQGFARPRLLAIGSILHAAQSCDVIWGSGVRSLDDVPWKPSLDIRSVRGPNSARVLKEKVATRIVPPVYGDPALLLPVLFPELHSGVQYASYRDNVLVLLHYRDKGKILPKPGVDVIGAEANDWKDVVRRITNASFVISTSLHGLIVADAFGIPSRGLQLNLGEPVFKYTDFYAGTGRRDYRFALSVDEALWLGPEDAPKVERDALLAAFPYELFNTTQSESEQRRHELMQAV
ncbi:uncharacterized protein L969DRAFT_88685 [Mixia osmundae IAM 14324]|uniref:Polysaccharide pyruvyl transferase domain-containing protein n=1 Tax=Mixia osmundae (strain CBS 9802 / IAM 14324 / JCM 22182 / KY 12970) TaxID=764103 RepID=G7DZ30_MIXOS|nr:uncharacterized protein L969DRAFT_88685 [Mixia osmundae IAM 14324]KEI38241.1 hypothetical protein L969DRAFT_88685 [Mixia osmundae IAM 14324]GAA95840.1 hypothetical protein E5Q_02497 [Mixia osmundae IAM 14324]